MNEPMVCVPLKDACDIRESLDLLIAISTRMGETDRVEVVSKERDILDAAIKAAEDAGRGVSK